MQHIERHDGALVPPCWHCGRRPRYVTTQDAGQPDTHRLECPNTDCGIATGEHWTVEEARHEWEELMGH